MKKKLTSRRELLKTTAFSGAALAAASLITSCTKKEESATTEETNAADAPASGDDLPYVSQDSPKAKALKYYENAEEAGAELRATKGKTEGAEQFCNNCQFYSADTEKCTLFPGKKVKSQAWCVSWSLKAQG